MNNTFDMQDLRHLNLFTKITGIDTRHFFKYNNMLVFCVPKMLIAKALGQDAENLRKMSKILGKRIRVVAQPRDIKDAGKFIEAIIAPVVFQNIDIQEDKIVINAGKMNKASLIGREKARLYEMKKITDVFFKRDFEIV